MIILGILMIAAIVIAILDNQNPTKWVAFLAKVGGLFAFLWFLVLLIKLIAGSTIPSPV